MNIVAKIKANPFYKQRALVVLLNHQDRNKTQRFNDLPMVVGTPGGRGLLEALRTQGLPILSPTTLFHKSGEVA
jgi:hypothetical protein